MKLQYQLNAAFTALLFVVMAVTGFVIYSLILNLLIQDEERQLEQKGELLVRFLTEEYGNSQNIGQFSHFLEEQNLQLILYDRYENSVYFSTMPVEIVQGFAENNNFTDNREGLWEYKNNKFVTSKKIFYPESTGLELILLTPVNDLQTVQQNFILRLFIVFLIGALAAVLLSYFMTNKLVTPLTRLKRQLKKIEKRQFDSIERVKATGEIREVEQSVYEMAKELQRYMNAQQIFFQNASHELKTPLMTIQGYAEGIKDGVFNKDEAAQHLNVMIAEVNRLKKIINEMILLAKLDSEPFGYDPSKVNIASLLERVMERVLPFIKEKNIHVQLKVDEQLFLYVDEDKLLRALLNILTNGVRYAASTVKITGNEENGEVVLVIEDDGEGIPDDLLPHIFHRFVKGQNGETGLGLAIARAIVEQSKGRITVNQSVLGGAKFTMHFSK
ncbi:sensor histidine kinase [Virgibacillus sp. W0430]|uniref:sensor histidine kinase n=1 Tax=Virgibacillus sp. W0430 TaxID=3391580 RepID=UPI003F458133